jgi:hypothetical protein
MIKIDFKEPKSKKWKEWKKKCRNETKNLITSVSSGNPATFSNLYKDTLNPQGDINKMSQTLLIKGFR